MSIFVIFDVLLLHVLDLDLDLRFLGRQGRGVRWGRGFQGRRRFNVEGSLLLEGLFVFLIFVFLLDLLLFRGFYIRNGLPSSCLLLLFCLESRKLLDSSYSSSSSFTTVSIILNLLFPELF